MANYYYRVIPFGLKNVLSTNQHLMNKICEEHIGNVMEVYINDMLIKTSKMECLIPNLQVVFDHLKKHDIRLNPQNVHLQMKQGSFWDLCLFTRESKAT